MEKNGCRVTIHQPNFNPYLGVVAKYLLADKIIHLDTVQFVKNEFQNRNRICADGHYQWLTVPVLHSHGQFISEVRINQTVHWRERHLKTLKQLYSKTPRFPEVFADLEGLYRNDDPLLVKWNGRFLGWLFEVLEIDTPVQFASEIPPTPADPNRRLISLVSSLGGTQYLAGSAGVEYMDRCLWSQSGIEVHFLRYHHPEYPQCHRGDFLPFCGVLDLLFRVPPSEARRIVLSGVETVSWNEAQELFSQ